MLADELAGVAQSKEVAGGMISDVVLDQVSFSLLTCIQNFGFINIAELDKYRKTDASTST